MDRDPRWPRLLLTCYPHPSASASEDRTRTRCSFDRTEDDSLPSTDNDNNNDNNNNDYNSIENNGSPQTLKRAGHRANEWQSGSSSTVVSSGSSVDEGDEGCGDPTHMWRLVWDSGASVIVELLEPATFSIAAAADDDQRAVPVRSTSSREQRWSSSDEACHRPNAEVDAGSGETETKRDGRCEQRVEIEMREMNRQKVREAAAAAFTYWPIEGSVHYGCLEVRMRVSAESCTCPVE